MWDQDLGFGTSAFHGKGELPNSLLYLQPCSGPRRVAGISHVPGAEHCQQLHSTPLFWGAHGIQSVWWPPCTQQHNSRWGFSVQTGLWKNSPLCRGLQLLKTRYLCKLSGNCSALPRACPVSTAWQPGAVLRGRASWFQAGAEGRQKRNKWKVQLDSAGSFSHYFFKLETVILENDSCDLTKYMLCPGHFISSNKKMQKKILPNY